MIERKATIKIGGQELEVQYESASDDQMNDEQMRQMKQAFDRLKRALNTTVTIFFTAFGEAVENVNAYHPDGPVVDSTAMATDDVYLLEGLKQEEQKG